MRCMPDNKPQTARPWLPVRISGAQIARIDRLRDPLIPREAFVRRLLDRALDAEERDRDREGAR
jgi:hypothetical protein